MAKRDFKIRRLDRVGVADAEEDKEFLDHCFVHTGDVGVLLNCSSPLRVVVGRTGSGKTALLLQAQKAAHGNVVNVAPESLALAHVTNSTILTFLNQLGVKLDIFFKLLWRHVFAVEILRAHHHLRSEEDQVGFIDRIRAVLSPEHRRAIKYMEEWGRTFWKETDYRVKELTSKLESEVKASIEGKVPGVSLDVVDAAKLSREQVVEVVHRAQQIVNQVQIRELSDILSMLDAVLEDEQKPVYVVIDRLDENWVDDRFRYLLIRALLETVRDFGKVRHAKVIVALRRDLIERVFKLTRDPGFQEEKYEGIYLPLDWSHDRLLEVLDARLKWLVHSHDRTASWNPRDLLPREICGATAADYIVSRTLLRPRDVIQFLNECVTLAVDRPAVTVEMMRQAEGLYSSARLHALADEWAADYPHLIDFIDLFKNRPALFPMIDITDDQLERAVLKFVDKDGQMSCELAKAALAASEARISLADFRRILVLTYHRTGLVGLKLDVNEPLEWAHGSRRSVSSAQLQREGVRIAVHPAFFRALGVRPPE